jgi:hypothetical protein
VSDLAARLRGFDGILVALILVVGYGTLSGGTNHYFVAGGRVFYYGGVLEWGLTLALLLLTLVLLDRRLGWRRQGVCP